MAMLDHRTLRSFVSVVDAGGFTRAGERVHRSRRPSAADQAAGRGRRPAAVEPDGKDVTPTEAGERLLSYARRLLLLAEEATP